MLAAASGPIKLRRTHNRFFSNIRSSYKHVTTKMIKKSSSLLTTFFFADCKTLPKPIPQSCESEDLYYFYREECECCIYDTFHVFTIILASFKLCSRQSQSLSFQALSTRYALKSGAQSRLCEAFNCNC